MRMSKELERLAKRVQDLEDDLAEERKASAEERKASAALRVQVRGLESDLEVARAQMGEAYRAKPKAGN